MSTPSKVPLPLVELENLFAIGWKLCHEKVHFPMQNPLALGGYPEKVWHICLASVPPKLGLCAETSWNSALGSHTSTVLLENPPGHRRLVIESTPVSDKYFTELQLKCSFEKPPTDPCQYLLPVLRAFIRLDVAKFSQFPVNIQPLVLADVQETALSVIKHPREGPPQPEEVIHTGDGFILVYPWANSHQSGWLLSVAARIAAKLDVKNDDTTRVPIHFRISITLGDVYLTKDLLGRQNYVGQAITDTERLISCMPSNLDDLVYFSDSVYRQHRADLSFFARLGSAADKHGNYHRLYSLEYHDYCQDQ